MRYHRSQSLPLSSLGRPLLVALAVLLWLVAGPAWAADPFGVVTVDLRPQAGEVPTHICVVSQGPGPRTRNALADFVDGKVLDDGTLRVLSEAWGRAGKAPRSCTGEGGVSCVPRIELPQGAEASAGLHAACAADSLSSNGGSDDARVLFLLLEHLEGSPPAIESLNLTGGVATIGVTANLRRVVVTARSLGGHYTPHERSYRAERSGLDSTLIVLPITPRCQSVDVVLKGTRVRSGDRERMRLAVHGQWLDVDSCIGALRGSSHMAVQIPRAPPEGGSVEVFVDPREGERPTATRFGGRWDGQWPSSRFELSAEQIAFTWERPECIYPENSCPSAMLADGVQCSATSVDGACQYLCPGEVDTSQIIEIDFPVVVTFKKEGPRQIWTDILQRPGQVLTSYVPGDQIYLDADLGDWKTEIPGSRISGFEILGNDGTVRRYGVGGARTLNVHVPSATCAPIRYELVGDLHYKEGVATTKDGRLEFGDARKTARILSFNLTIAQGGGAGLISGAPPNVVTEYYFLGQAQLAANFRPRQAKYARVAGELRLGAHIGQWGFYGPETVAANPRRVRTKVAWGRFLFEPAVVIDVVHPLSISAGIGLGSSWPLQGSNVPTTDRFSFILAPSIDARFYVRRWISFVLQGRGVFFERTSLVELDANGDLDRKLRRTVTLYGLYGVVLNF